MVRHYRRKAGRRRVFWLGALGWYIDDGHGDGCGYISPPEGGLYYRYCADLAYPVYPPRLWRFPSRAALPSRMASHYRRWPKGLWPHQTRRRRFTLMTQAGITDINETSAIRQAQRKAFAKEQLLRGKGQKLVVMPARLFEDDAAYIAKVAEQEARHESQLIRMAVHMWCNAHRANPRSLLG